MSAKVESPEMLIPSRGSICTATRKLIATGPYWAEALLSPLPDVGQVSRPAVRDHEQSVDPNIVAISHVARCKPLGGYRDAAQVPFVESKGGGILGGTRLHLDKGQRAATA